jgi:hypothetical protein
MVTFRPVAVVRVKPDEDVLVTVPDAPPGSGPDRALDPPPDPIWPAVLLAVDEPLPVDELPPVAALTIP